MSGAVRALGGLLLTGALTACQAEPVERAAPPEGAPDVLLIVVDTLRRDHLGAYGHERATSPHIDRLAREGVRYDRALSHAPWTSPSVAAILTSRDPLALGMTELESVLPDDALLLSEILAHHGYRTGAVVSHSLCSARWGFDQGFDTFDDSNADDHESISSPRVTDLALEFVAGARDRPYFLWLHYFDPHFAYREHPDFRFPAEEPYRGPAGPDTPFGSLLEMQHTLGPEDARELMRRYDSEIAFTDHHIGRLLDALREQGRLERTLVLLTADHGEEFLDHGRLGHTKTLYDEVVGVPLIVRGPDRATGVVSQPVALVDLLPTVLARVGLPLPPGVEGRALPGPREPADGARILFTATQRRQPKRAAVQGRYKLIRDLHTGSLQLYDLAADPGERRDQTARLEEATFAALRDALAAYERRTAVAAGPRLSLDADDRRRLEALGYGTGDERP